MPHCVIPCQQRHRGAAPDPGGGNTSPPPAPPCFSWQPRRAAGFDGRQGEPLRKGRKGGATLRPEVSASSFRTAIFVQACALRQPASVRPMFPQGGNIDVPERISRFLKKSVAQLSGKHLFFEGRPSRLSGSASAATENRFSTLDESSAATNILFSASPKTCLRSQRSGNENEKTVPAHMRGRNSLPAQKTFRAPAQSARHALHRKRLRRSGMEIEN